MPKTYKRIILLSVGIIHCDSTSPGVDLEISQSGVALERTGSTVTACWNKIPFNSKKQTVPTGGSLRVKNVGQDASQETGIVLFTKPASGGGESLMSCDSSLNIAGLQSGEEKVFSSPFCCGGDTSVGAQVALNVYARVEAIVLGPALADVDVGNNEILLGTVDP